MSTIRQRWLGRLGEAIASAFARRFSWGGYTVGSKGTAPHSMIADQPYGAATPGNPCGAPLPSAVWTLWDRMLRCWTRLPPGEAGPAFGIRADGRSAKAIQYGIGKGYNHIFRPNYVQYCHGIRHSASLGECFELSESCGAGTQEMRYHNFVGGADKENNGLAIYIQRTFDQALTRSLMSIPT